MHAQQPEFAQHRQGDDRLFRARDFWRTRHRSPDEARSSLSHCVYDLGKRAARKARLCHDVVLFGHAELGMTQEVLNASDVLWIVD